MTPVPLDAAQQAAVAALIAAGRLQAVPADARRAAGFLAAATDKIGQLGLLTSEPVRHGIAYDAAREIGEALLAAYGLRTTGNGVGHHEAVGRFLTVVIDAPPDAAASARRFDQHRRARNNQNYRAVTIGSAASRDAVEMATALLAAAQARGI